MENNNKNIKLKSQYVEFKKRVQNIEWEEFLSPEDAEEFREAMDEFEKAMIEFEKEC